MPATKQLVAHVSPESAYIIPRFPLNYAQNTMARYWVETKPAYGQRVVSQNRNPHTNEWYKPKFDAYYDVAIITVISDPNHYNCGHVIPVQVNLKDLTDLNVLLQFANYYVFTPFQKKQIVKVLQHNKYFQPIQWKTDPLIDPLLDLNIELINMAESDLKLNRMAARKTNAVGIPIESLHDAERRERNESQASQVPQASQSLAVRAAKLPSADTKPFKMPKPDDDDTTGMTPEQIAIYNDLMGKS